MHFELIIKKVTMVTNMRTEFYKDVRNIKLLDLIHKEIKILKSAGVEVQIYPEIITLN